MNSIAPHSPPIPTSPGQLPTAGGGGGKKQDDTSFDDVMSGAPTKGLPSPIEDHSPPPNLDDTDTDDQTGVSPPRPMRWKGNRGPAADAAGPDAGTGVPLVPTQPDLRSMVPAVALSPGWQPPAAPPDGGDGKTIDAGSTTPDAATGVSASDARGGSSSTGSYPIMSSRLAPTTDWVPTTLVADNTPTTAQPAGTSLPATSPVEAVAGLTDRLPLPGDTVIAGPTDRLPPPAATANQGATAQTSTDNLPSSVAPTLQAAVMSSHLTPMPSSGADTAVADPTDPVLPASGTAVPVLAGEVAVTPDIRPGPTNIERGNESQTPTIATAKTGPAESDPTIAWSQTTIIPPRVPPVTTGASISKDAQFNADPIPTNATTSVSADTLPATTTDSVPKLDAAGLWSGANPGTKGSSDVASTPAPTTTLNPQAELSAPLKTDEAKIAAPTMADTLRVRDSKMLAAQIPVGKLVKQNNFDDGTPVAKDAEVVNATLSNNEKTVQSSQLPKRAGGVSSGVASSSRQTGGSTTGRQILTDMPVTGATEPAATAAQVVATPTLEPTAARQVVRVETLLQNALTAGESVRPNGQDHMEMRVRLGGGSEDVTVRMQVVNDRMQVTFQTNSPEMRKALEQGWDQFSTTAAHTSTLALSAPKFETTPAGVVAQGQGTNAQGFSFDQQNSRRQEASTPAFDDGGSTAGNRHADLPTAPTTLPATVGQATTRRWTGWA